VIIRVLLSALWAVFINLVAQIAARFALFSFYHNKSKKSRNFAEIIKIIKEFD